MAIWTFVAGWYRSDGSLAHLDCPLRPICMAPGVRWHENVEDQILCTLRRTPNATSDFIRSTVRLREVRRLPFLKVFASSRESSETPQNNHP